MGSGSYSGSLTIQLALQTIEQFTVYASVVCSSSLLDLLVQVVRNIFNGDRSHHDAS